MFDEGLLDAFQQLWRPKTTKTSSDRRLHVTGAAPKRRTVYRTQIQDRLLYFKAN